MRLLIATEWERNLLSQEKKNIRRQKSLQSVQPKGAVPFWGQAEPRSSTSVDTDAMGWCVPLAGFPASLMEP